MYRDGYAVKGRVSNAFSGPENFTYHQIRAVLPNVRLTLTSDVTLTIWTSQVGSPAAAGAATADSA